MVIAPIWHALVFEGGGLTSSAIQRLESMTYRAILVLCQTLSPNKPNIGYLGLFGPAIQRIPLRFCRDRERITLSKMDGQPLTSGPSSISKEVASPSSYLTLPLND